MSNLEESFTSTRWRCFGRLDPTANRCGAPAAYKAPNPIMGDRICYFCADCRPEGAVGLTALDVYTLVHLAVMLTVPASTMHPTAAGQEATARVRAALAELGASIEFGRAWGELRQTKAGLIAQTGAPPAAPVRDVFQS